MFEPISPMDNALPLFFLRRRRTVRSGITAREGERMTFAVSGF